MSDQNHRAFGRLFALALAFPLLISVAASALLIGQLTREPVLASFLGAFPLATVAALSALLTIGTAAALYARAELLRVFEDHGRALELARDALGAREEFLVVASHELKTPLTSLRLQVGSALRALHSGRTSGTAHLSERLEVADRQAERLAQIINGLLDSSRAAQPADLVLGEVDLVALTRDVVAHLEQTFSGAGCELLLALPSAAVWGEWDAARLRQALRHLLSNAAKYGRGHPVEIRLECDANAARLSVRDHGIGIDPGQHRKIFERFERAASPRNYGGFGLGLWVARRAVQALGGTIGVESRQGGGSTFTIELPRAEPRLAAAEELVEPRLCS